MGFHGIFQKLYNSTCSITATPFPRKTTIVYLEHVLPVSYLGTFSLLEGTA